MALSDHYPDPLELGFRDRLSNGRRAMAHLIRIWHERNGWSHKVLPALADALELGRLHSSQISNLRNGKLISPGPEVFLALAQVNGVLYLGIDSISEHLEKVHPQLLKVLSDSSIPLLDDQGQPLRAGELLEIFLGLIPLPLSFDWFIEDHEAEALSVAIGDCFCKGQSWRKCRKEVMAAYPIKKTFRQERFAKVMSGLSDYTAEELDSELFDLYATYIALGGSSDNGIKGFIQQLRCHAFGLDIKS